MQRLTTVACWLGVRCAGHVLRPTPCSSASIISSRSMSSRDNIDWQSIFRKDTEKKQRKLDPFVPEGPNDPRGPYYQKMKQKPDEPSDDYLIRRDESESEQRGYGHFIFHTSFLPRNHNALCWKEFQHELEPVTIIEETDEDEEKVEFTTYVKPPNDYRTGFEDDDRREREIPIPKMVERKVKGGRSVGRGARKTAHASAVLRPGKGKVRINGKELYQYFNEFREREKALHPLVVADRLGRYDVVISVKGSGQPSQGQAAGMAVADALQNFEPDLRWALRKGGYLTRDPRMVERKKIGKVKARKGFQWSKR